MKKSKSSARWLQDHESDEFVLKARREGYRSRASYKLLEIDDKFRLLTKGSVVVDLGAAPGGWAQVAVARAGSASTIIGVDLLEIEPMGGAEFIQGDFTESGPLELLMDKLAQKQVSLVISDMAPNLSGMTDIDQPRATYLVELALDFAGNVLEPGGALVMKCFEGEGLAEIRQVILNKFKQLNNFKPKASRGRSREIYLVAQKFKG
ncbi:MAG: 23S rRNA (uridine2552-2'-O)-methyltransferase [Candidatus Azotimanducaceae bacterium]|jgi:23S rRNA (uridine2552-2'-O)-methyltransferase